MPFIAEDGAANTKAVLPFSLLSQAGVMVGKNVRNPWRVHYRVNAHRGNFRWGRNGWSSISRQWTLSLPQNHFLCQAEALVEEPVCCWGSYQAKGKLHPKGTVSNTERLNRILFPSTDFWGSLERSKESWSWSLKSYLTLGSLGGAVWSGTGSLESHWAGFEREGALDQLWFTSGACAAGMVGRIVRRTGRDNVWRTLGVWHNCLAYRSLNFSKIVSSSGVKTMPCDFQGSWEDQMR